jgi:RHS repeat-associated protein
VQLDQDRHVRIEEPSFAAKILPDLAPASGPDTGIQPDADGSITAGDAWLLSAVQAGWMTTSTTAPESIDPRVLLHASARRSLYGTDPRVVYLHTDSLGSTVATTDDQGASLGRAEFYPFGQVRMAQGEGDPHGFTGKEADAATGLLDFGARLLDPVTGRWTAPDPSFRVHSDLDEEQVEEATGAYGYVDGNPVNARDPDGEAKVGCLTSLMGRFKTARALMKGSWRPNVLYHYRFNLTPNQKIDFKTAWKMVKTASQALKVGDTHGAFVPKSRSDSNSLLMETRSAGHALSGYYKTMRLAKNDYRVEHFSSRIAPSLANIAQGVSGERFLDIRGMHQLHAVQGMQLGLQETHINQGHQMKALTTGGRGQRK